MSVMAIDNATTCEQYVVAKLKSDEATIKRMNETVMELNCEIKKLEAERDSKIAKFIREFTPELSEIYTDLVAEAKEEDE